MTSGSTLDALPREDGRRAWLRLSVRIGVFARTGGCAGGSGAADGARGPGVLVIDLWERVPCEEGAGGTLRF